MIYKPFVNGAVCDQKFSKFLVFIGEFIVGHMGVNRVY
jgi:hypothetical protein